MITAPNGAGKTHVLRLIAAALTMDSRTLFGIDFDKLTLQFDDDTELSYATVQDNEPRAASLVVEASLHGETELLTIKRPGSLDAADEPPPYLRQVSPNRWHDMRSDRYLTGEQVAERYESRVNLADHPIIASIVSGERAYLIDTKRLESDRADFASRGYDQARPGPRASRIRHYLGELQQKVSAARSESVTAAQSEDLSFATRALAAASLSVNENELRRRYARIARTYEDLGRNSLSVGHTLMEFPEKTTPTIRRILHVFFEDMERRQAPLLPVNALVNALRSVLDTKLSASGKATGMTERGGLRIIGRNGRNVEISRLSSGEQHLVALFTMLLFGAAPNSVVLLDEPEISLHAAWKHAFLDDVVRISELNGLQVIIATHSTAIINGRWELTEELAFSAVDDHDDDTQEEDSLDLLSEYANE
ncbi:AAA family ATPase [Agrococcus sp. Marseille-Q4369]|uniref:AAA family ATPase n=1 Tax=Agrococcus sp. Marseille-Q4369 TaxID=2810513 RepID=UPI001B8B5A84|nr:AAA family ATPase [Agrococcus sp. Marseille-Q4369]QUW17893.1 AAA family ATPase [Agrococcus sp. Marseille-Q4369]